MPYQLNQLESEAEAQRALFAEAIDDMRVRIVATADDLRSPTRIVRRTAKKWRNSMEQSARDNPIRALSIAALLVYPLARIARALPLPMVFAGAGVFLAGKARFSTTKVGDLLADARVRAHEAASRVVETTEQVRDGAARDLQLVQARVTASVSAASDVIQHAARSEATNIEDKVERAADSGSAAFSTALRTVTPSDTTIQTAKDSAQAAVGAAQDLTRRTVNFGAAYSRHAVNAAAQNPLLIAGIGLAAGGLFAALLPRTKVDNQVLGGLARTLQAGAKRVAKEGHQAASKAVGDLYDRVADEAESRDLTVKAVQRVAEDVNERVSDLAPATKRVIKRNGPTRESHHD